MSHNYLISLVFLQELNLRHMDIMTIIFLHHSPQEPILLGSKSILSDILPSLKNASCGHRVKKLSLFDPLSKVLSEADPTRFQQK